MNQKEIVIDAVYKAMRTKAGKLRIYRTSAVESPFEILFKIEARWLDFYLTFDTETGKLTLPSISEAESALRLIGVEVDLQEKPKAVKPKRKAAKG